MYGKYMSVAKKYPAHAESAYNEGDLVEIQEGCPISKTKPWTVTNWGAGCFD
jgi:small subunit ribosomal protein S17